MHFIKVTPEQYRKTLISSTSFLFFFISVLVLFYSMLFQDIWPKTHEGFRYLYLYDHFQEAFKAGHYYPRWLANANGGYGYPSFIYYQPGFFFLVLIFSSLGFDTIVSIQLCLISVTYLGLFGVYLLARSLSDRITALFCTFIFLLTPYLYSNLLVRGDLSEFVSMLLTPWAFYFLVVLEKKLQNSQSNYLTIIGLAISVYTVIVMHPTTALFFLPLLCISALYLGLKASNRKYYMSAVAISITFALILCSPYWYTVFQLKYAIHFENAFEGIFSAKLHTVNVAQFFSRQWGFGVSLPGNNDTMSFQLGIIHFATTLLGAYFGRKIRLIQIAFIAYVVLLLLMTEVASYLWEHLDLLRYVQFPWRILSVIALLQVICTSGLVYVNLKDKYKIVILSALSMIAIVWYHDQFTIRSMGINPQSALEQHRDSRLLQMHTFTVKNEMLPITASTSTGLRPRGHRIPIVQSDSSPVRFYDNHSTYFIHASIMTTKASQIVINQLYFPGWRVVVNGKPIPESVLIGNLTKDGRMLLNIKESGKIEIKAEYDGPPGWRLRIALTILFVILGVVFTYYLELTRKRTLNKPR